MLSIFRRLMARGGKNRSVCGEEDSSGTSQGNQESGEVLGCVEHEIAQLTKLQSGPPEHLGKAVAGKPGRHVSTVKMLASRECNFSGRGRFSKADSCHMLGRFLPVRGPTKVDQMRSRTYVSQFSSDGSLFVAGFQRSQIRIYNVDKGWRVQKDILAKSMRWTITDTCLSPDQRFLVYSSMSPLAHIVNIESSTTESHANVTELHDGLNFSLNDDDEDEFAIFSVKFSTDGRELVAATGDNSIYVYDLGANKLSLRIPAHTDDINTVCFADDTGHLIYSGSDDSFVKVNISGPVTFRQCTENGTAVAVWDRRCLTSRGQTAAGVLTGHLEGITCIDTRGDGRYLISNGKDQSIKLWDIRKMTSNTSDRANGYSGFDYRYMEYPEHAKKLKHPNDLSLGTYRGHGVLCTLIRCYFSPVYSTAQRYIYTGSSDCSAYIYDLVSGNQVAKLEYHEAPVRDCSWHPYYPMLVTSAWDGVIARWEFPGKEEPNNLPRLRKNRRRMLY